MNSKQRMALWQEFLAYRGVDLEDVCGKCKGAGTRVYGSTSTWRGGIGGQRMTTGVCDRCWGSGSETKRWPSHRQMEGLSRRIDELKDQLEDAKFEAMGDDL